MAGRFTSVRIATWNVNSLKVRMPRVEEWLAYAEPDIACVQETKLSDANFPHMTFGALGYESVHHGSGQWNGVAILSKVGIHEASVLNGFAERLQPDQDTSLITAGSGGGRVTSPYVPNRRARRCEHHSVQLP